MLLLKLVSNPGYYLTLLALNSKIHYYKNTQTTLNPKWMTGCDTLSRNQSGRTPMNIGHSQGHGHWDGMAPSDQDQPAVDYPQWAVNISLPGELRFDTIVKAPARPPKPDQPNPRHCTPVPSERILMYTRNHPAQACAGFLFSFPHSIFYILYSIFYILLGCNLLIYRYTSQHYVTCTPQSRYWF